MTGSWRREVVGGAFVAAAVLGSLAFYLYYGPGPLEAPATVIVERGLGVRGIAGRLAEAGVIRSTAPFVVASSLSGQARRLRAGEYVFPPRVSMRSVLDMMERGVVVQRRLTVPEGFTTHQVLDLVAAAPGLEGSVTLAPPEGALLPETYTYTHGQSKDEIVRTMMRAMDEALAELWPQRIADLPFKSPREAVILASLVEKETALSEERRRIAGVFINRLRRGLKLQSDPTVIYALTGGKGLLERLVTNGDLAFDHPYNTYIYAGLPPGPIANPGLESLRAVLNPTETDELYFVADGQGGHRFARTLREHQRNVAHWRKIQKKLTPPAVASPAVPSRESGAQSDR